MPERQNIKDIPLNRLPAIVEALGLKKFAANQLIQWLYQKGATSFDEMTNLSKDARRILSENFHVGRLKLKKTLESADGTKKFAWELSDGNIIESVLIPSEPYSKVPARKRTCEVTSHESRVASHERLTLCISTQVGCAVGCSFCRTAGMGFVRNLTQSEIVDQILEASKQETRNMKQDFSCLMHHASCFFSHASRITNVVLMGMGEPLANYDNVLEAIKIMTDTKCLGLSKRHVTLSTSGLIPGIERLAKDDPGIKLAISLNATTDEQREKIMPVNKKYPLAKLFEALKKYSAATKRSRITFEYVMIDGFNDSNDDAKRLVKFLSYFPSKVNLIPLNPPHPPFSKGGREGGFKGVRPRPNNADATAGSSNTAMMGSDPASVQRFAQFLRNKHIQVNIRASRGQDILAACGQLAGGKS